MVRVGLKLCQNEFSNVNAVSVCGSHFSHFLPFSSIACLMGKRELVVLLNLSSWCLVMVERLFLVVPRGCLRFVIVVFPDHTHLLFLTRQAYSKKYRQISTRTYSYKFSFFPYIIPVWNSLPASVAEAPSLVSFKKGLSPLSF